MPMDHQLGALLGHDGLETAGVPQTSPARGTRAVGRVVDHHDSREPLPPGFGQEGAERRALLRTERS